ncbi:hypothetical protein HJFPF1_02207 [Paramyrothecium foliicola]|nr:hypothetical protein HJFPF1_02207 [Paramyrothecium foliicola]
MAQQGGTWSPRQGSLMPRTQTQSLSLPEQILTHKSQQAKHTQLRPRLEATSTSDVTPRGKEVRQDATAPNDERTQGESDGWDLVEAPPRADQSPAQDSDEVISSTSMEFTVGWGSWKRTVFSYQSTVFADSTENQAGDKLTDDQKEHGK